MTKIDVVQRYKSIVQNSTLLGFDSNDIMNRSHGDLSKIIKNQKDKIQFMSYDNNCGIREACYEYYLKVKEQFPEKYITFNGIQHAEYFDVNASVVSLVPDNMCKNIVLNLKKNGCFVIGIFVWELSNIESDIFIDVLKLYDKVIVPTYNNQKVLESYNISSVVVHHLIPSSMNIEPIDIDCIDSSYVFYNINSNTHRKNLETLISSFDEVNKIFPDTKLVLKVNKLLQTNNPNIIQITTYLKEEQINFIHSVCNCFVSTSFSEGVGLGMIKAAMFENTVITNGFSGILEYLPYAITCNYILSEVQDDYVHFNKSQLWGNILQKDLICKMKLCYNKHNQLKMYNTLQKEYLEELTKNQDLTEFVEFEKITFSSDIELIFCEAYNRNIYLALHDKWICIHLKENRLWNSDVESHLRSNLKKNDKMIEVGSYIGIHCYTISEILTEGSLVCFESQPSVFNILEKNVESLYNVNAHNFIISDTNSSKYVNLEEFYSDNPGSNCTYRTSSGELCAISTMTIQNYIELYNFIPTVIKISANDDSYSVLNGMKTILNYVKPRIYVSHNLHQQSICEMLKLYNYTVCDIGNGTLYFQ